VNLNGSIFKTMITRCALDQAECIENTLALPHQISTLILRRLMGEKNRLKAERAWFLSRRERRAEPETEPLLHRWGKRGVFYEPKSRSTRFFSTPSLIIPETPPQAYP